VGQHAGLILREGTGGLRSSERDGDHRFVMSQGRILGQAECERIPWKQRHASWGRFEGVPVANAQHFGQREVGAALAFSSNNEVSWLAINPPPSRTKRRTPSAWASLMSATFANMSTLNPAVLPRNAAGAR